MRLPVWLMALALLVGSGCTAIAYEIGTAIHDTRVTESLRSWVGRDIHQAITNFGPPAFETPNGAVMMVGWRMGSCQAWFDVPASGVIAGFHCLGDC